MNEEKHLFSSDSVLLLLLLSFLVVSCGQCVKGVGGVHLECFGWPGPRLLKRRSRFLSLRGLCCCGLRWLSGPVSFHFFWHRYRLHVAASLSDPTVPSHYAWGFLFFFSFLDHFVHVPAKHDGWIFHVQHFFFFFIMYFHQS